MNLHLVRVRRVSTANANAMQNIKKVDKSWIVRYSDEEADRFV